jgi:hypothetical protein
VGEHILSMNGEQVAGNNQSMRGKTAKPELSSRLKEPNLVVRKKLKVESVKREGEEEKRFQVASPCAS